MRKLAPAALTAAATLLLLAGCSAGGQSVADACSIAEEKVNAAQGDLTEAMSAATSGDMDSVGDLIGNFTAALDEAESEITNEEVKPLIEDLNAQFGQVGTALEELAGVDTSDPTNVDQLTEISDEMMTVSQDAQTTATELGELCNS